MKLKDYRAEVEHFESLDSLNDADVAALYCLSRLLKEAVWQPGFGGEAGALRERTERLLRIK